MHLEDSRIEVSEETQPAVLEVLCDECEATVNLADFEEPLRREMILTISSR